MKKICLASYYTEFDSYLCVYAYRHILVYIYLHMCIYEIETLKLKVIDKNSFKFLFFLFFLNFGGDILSVTKLNVCQWGGKVSLCSDKFKLHNHAVKKEI